MTLERTTIFSPCRVYRYTLWREWGTGTLPLTELASRRAPDSYLQVIGLNPSTADETKDDPTIRRCIGFAKRLGFGALCMTNLFAFRATDPRVMKQCADPVGFQNDFLLRAVAQEAGLVVAAWGAHGSHQLRSGCVVDDFYRRGIKLHCFGRNADGSPKHPLYLPKDCEIVLLQT